MRRNTSNYLADLFRSVLRYCNFFSLDAVVIALLWQELLARSAAVSLGRADRLLLGLSVWSVYLLDHLFDATSTLPLWKKERASSDQLSNQALRHHFVKKHRLGLIFLLVAALSGDFFLAWQLPHSLFLAGLILGGITTFYLCSNFFFVLQGRWFQGREAIIALIFGVGCALVPLLHTQYPLRLIIPIVALTLLALLNCLLIARMERNAPLSSLWPQTLPLPNWVLGFSLFFLMTSKMSGQLSFVGAAFWGSLAGLTFVPLLAKKVGYEIASFAADSTLVLGAIIALLWRV